MQTLVTLCNRSKFFVTGLHLPLDIAENWRIVCASSGVSMKSLAEALGVSSLEAEAAATPLKPVEPTPSVSAKEFCQSIIDSPEFRRYLRDGITLNDLPTPIICKIMDHAWGKPVERLEVEDKTVRERMSPEALEQRAAVIMEAAKRLKEQQRAETTSSPSDDNEDDSDNVSPSVH